MASDGFVSDLDIDEVSLSLPGGLTDDYYYCCNYNSESGSRPHSNNSESAVTAANTQLLPITTATAGACNWFHGSIDRNVAERLLIDNATPGVFLVRCSDSRPGSFVLSVLSQTDGVQHFRVTAVCGQFYLGGVAFQSLGDLVSFYTEEAKILLFPLAPLGPVAPLERKMVAKVSFTGMAGTDELSFCKGDLLLVQHSVDDQWLWAAKQEQPETSGLVFEGLLDDFACRAVSPTELPYFFNRITRQELTRRLTQNGCGSYLLRPSEGSPGNYAIYLNTGNNKVEKFLVTKTPDGRYEIGGRMFDSLCQVVDRYRQHEICDGHLLEFPICRDDVILNHSDNNVDAAAAAAVSIEEINNKLRQSRLSQIGDVSIAEKLLKRASKGKQWKPILLELHALQGQLFCFDHPKKSKQPKNVLDLCYCHLYPVDSSLFDRPHCWQLVQNQLRSLNFYFQCDSPQQLQRWLGHVRPLCTGFRLSSSSPFTSIRAVSPAALPVNSCRLKRLRHLNVTCYEAKNLSTDKSLTSLFCLVILGAATVCRTVAQKLANNNHVIWDENFYMENIPLHVSQVGFLLRQRSNKQREAELGCATISLNSGVSLTADDSSCCDSQWLCLEVSSWLSKHLVQNHNNSCQQQPVPCLPQLRVSVQQIDTVVMPLDEYKGLRQLLQEHDFWLCDLLASLCNQHERPRLAHALMGVFGIADKGVKHEQLQFLVAQTCREIDRTDDVTALFRSGSLGVFAMDELLRTDAYTYVRTVMGTLLPRIADVKRSCEVDPSRLDKAAELQHNLNHLQSGVRELCQAIFSSVAQFPPSVRFVLSHLKRRASEKWPRDQLLKLRPISAFVFLRLFTLALVRPKQFCLPTENLSQRNLVLLAKVMQNLSNLVVFGAKEVHMECVNELIRSQMPLMANFLNQVSSYSFAASASLVDNNDFLSSSSAATSNEHSFPEQHLACVFQMCQSHLTELEQLLSSTDPQEGKVSVLRSLVSVVRVLQAHQLQYAALSQ